MAGNAEIIIGERGKPVCGVKSRTTGKLCQNYLVSGSTRCRMHGGRQKKGVLSKAFKHGRYSKYMPEQLRESYAKALDDPQLISLDNELALCDARLNQLLDMASQQSGGAEDWKELSRAYRVIEQTRITGDKKQFAVALDDIERAIGTGSRGSGLWLEIAALIELRRKLADTERKRVTETQQMITAERAMMLVAAVSEAIKSAVYKFVEDEKTRHEILNSVSTDVGRIISGTNTSIAGRTANKLSITAGDSAA